MKYDCSKVLDYIYERKRLCGSLGGNCGNCELRGFCTVSGTTQESIDIVQKWSDEHPEKTRQDKFLEQYPNAAIRLDGISPIKPCWIDNKWADEIDCETISCADCMRKYWEEVQN